MSPLEQILSFKTLDTYSEGRQNMFDRVASFGIHSPWNKHVLDANSVPLK